MPTDPAAHPATGHAHLAVDNAWLAKRTENAIDGALPIVDAHHHLWDRSRSPRYLLDDLLADLDSGHNIIGTVFVECRAMYRADGPAGLRPVGETEFVNGIAAMSASGDYGASRLCRGIVGSADLRLGDQVRAVIEAHQRAGGDRFRGIRQIAACHDSPQVRVAGPVPQPELLADSDFRKGFALLAPSGLSFDAWVYHTQLGEVADLARAFPDTAIMLNHSGGPIRIGPYANRREEGFSEWRDGMQELARCPNVLVKLGGLGMRLGGYAFNERPRPPSSADLAAAWRPFLETCIEGFGSKRCMFESNFPVEKGSCSYGILWNAFKRITSACSPDEKTDLFSRTAACAYRLDGLSVPAGAGSLFSLK